MSIEESIENLRRFKNIKVLYGKYTMTNEQLSGLRQSIGNVLDELENLKNELDKKDKVIELMSRAINNYDSQLVINHFSNADDVKQYFYEKVEEEK